MKKLLLLISLISSIGGTTYYTVDTTVFEDIMSSVEYTEDQKTTAYDIVSESLENQYNKITNGEALYERNCN
jgi:hypothetical protein